MESPEPGVCRPGYHLIINRSSRRPLSCKIGSLVAQSSLPNFAAVKLDI